MKTNKQQKYKFYRSEFSQKIRRMNVMSGELKVFDKGKWCDTVYSISDTKNNPIFQKISEQEAALILALDN